MKNQALIFFDKKSKKLKCRMLQFLFAVLSVNVQAVYLSRTQYRGIHVVLFLLVLPSFYLRLQLTYLTL